MLSYWSCRITQIKFNRWLQLRALQPSLSYSRKLIYMLPQANLRLSQFALDRSAGGLLLVRGTDPTSAPQSDPLLF